jgi:hypothetical protein
MLNEALIAARFMQCFCGVSFIPVQYSNNRFSHGRRLRIAPLAGLATEISIGSHFAVTNQRLVYREGKVRLTRIGTAHRE